MKLRKMVLFTSDGLAVMLGRRNGVAVKGKEHIPHLVQHHFVAHRKDLGHSGYMERSEAIARYRNIDANYLFYVFSFYNQLL